MSNNRLELHTAFVQRWKADGKRTQMLTTPCCAKGLEVLAPPRDDGQKWDSLVTCPHCGELFMKVVTFAKAEGISINWDEASA